MNRSISDFEKHAEGIIKPLRTAQWQADYQWSRLEQGLERLASQYGELELNPDFQRGHVWTPEQQVAFITSCLRGVVASNGFLIQLNCPSWSDKYDATDLPPGLQCIDGLQRYTAVVEFVRGNIRPFGFSADELANTRFSPARFYMKVAIHGFTKRADLLEHYLSINAGGTPHSADEIERVRGLLAQARTWKE